MDSNGGSTGGDVETTAIRDIFLLQGEDIPGQTDNLLAFFTSFSLAIRSIFGYNRATDHDRRTFS